MYYVDCFSGRGKYHNEGMNDSVLGSPLIALEAAKMVRVKYGKELKCVFIEKDKKVISDLGKFVAPHEKDGFDINLIQGSINEKIDEVIKIVAGRAPVFFFVDPAGISISRDMISKALGIPNVAKEFLINYICKGVERTYAFGKKCNDELPISVQKKAIGNLRRIQKFFGEDWENLTEDEKENLKLYLNIVADHNEDKPEKHQLGAKVIDICYNKGRSKYYLIFLSRNLGAKSIIDDIYTKIEVDGTLFQSLSRKEKSKMFQGKFDFDITK